MAKKIKLDFSKVEERSGFNQRQMPEGLYEGKVTSLEQRDASDGTPMLVYGLAPTQQKYATRNFPYYCKLQQNQLWKLRDLFVAAGETIPKKSTQVDPEKIIGAKIAIEVGDGTGQYSDRSEIVSVYPLSTLEGLDEDSDEEEYDDTDEDGEEYDDESEDDSDDEDYDDEDDSDEDDEEYEDDDEDLDEDEDEDDEELDDEELYEDDEDDEDEEEEPAPKKKAAAKKAPAKKTPAKKAPAKVAKAEAPAKRVVKRRR